MEGNFDLSVIRCGSVCCAIGCLPILEPEIFEYSDPYPGDMNNTHYVHPKGVNCNVHGEIAARLGVNNDQYEYMFMPWRYDKAEHRNPMAVVARIKEVINGYSGSSSL